MSWIRDSATARAGSPRMPNKWIRAVPDDRQAIVVGGTGFYVRALAEGLFREPPMDNERRERLRLWTSSFAGLSSWASRLDSGYVGGGRQRSARAVEVALLTGRPLSWWQQQAKLESQISPCYVRLTAPRAVLHRRIERESASYARKRFRGRGANTP